MASVKNYASENLRNVGFFSHSGAGTTTLCDAALHVTGATNRLLSVDEENSTFDTEPEEHQRRVSVCLHLGQVEWEKNKINLIDTPGDLNFQADVRYATEAADLGAVVVSAVDGVEVGTEVVNQAIVEAGLARALVINKMDREHADFDKVLGEVQESLGVRPTVLTLPIGASESFRGVVDVVRQKAFVWDGPQKAEFKTEEVPAELKDTVEELHNALVENVAESDEELMEKYFEGELSEEDIHAGLRKAVVSGELLPVLAVSARQLIGLPQLLDFFCELAPSPLDVGPFKAKNADGEEVEVPATADGPLAAFCFKTFVDPFAGKLNCLRVRRGEFPGSGEFTNVTLDTKERYSVIMQLQGKNQEPLAQGVTGDIVVLSKLKETGTGNTITDGSAPLHFDTPPLPPRAISFAVKPKTQTDEEKLGPSIYRLMEEDHCIEFGRDEVTHEFLLSGLGQAHVESIVARLKTRFNVQAELSTPKVPYKETIRKAAEAHGRHKKQTGGRGQFADCWVRFEPLPRGSGYQYIDKIVGGVIPRQFIPAVDKGIQKASAKGTVGGFPMVDFSATVYDGQHHPVDSSDIAFQVAGSLAYKDGLPKCEPVVLEPIMKLEITIPDETMGDVIGDLNGRRGRVLGMEPKGNKQLIRALVPMAEILSYASDLKSITSARGMFIMEFDHYEEVPPNIQEKIVAEVQKAAEADG